MKCHLSDAVISKYQSTNSLLFLRDDNLTGFGARITRRSVSFIVETKDVLGKTKRKTIGKFPLLTTEEAREKALVTLKELKLGQSTLPDLKTAFLKYLDALNHRPSTIKDYKLIYSNYLEDWSDLKIDAISREMIVEKYTSSCNRSISQANKAMRYLSAVLNFYEVENSPMTILSQRRLRKPSKPKTSYIPLKDLPKFYKGLSELKNGCVGLYLELLLHTGLRANEAMQITLDSISTCVLIIEDTKTHTDHQIPLTKWLLDNLVPYLEANPDGFKYKYIRKSLNSACKYLPYVVTRHDLRRAFASYASESGCDYLLIKRALNHSVGDITARYIQTSPSSLLPVFNSVADLIAKNR